VTWLPIVLLALGGFLIGGVLSTWRSGARTASVVLGIFALGAIVGGILWLLDE
jgi:hypothetical protein